MSEPQVLHDCYLTSQVRGQTCRGDRPVEHVEKLVLRTTPAPPTVHLRPPASRTVTTSDGHSVQFS